MRRGQRQRTETARLEDIVLDLLAQNEFSQEFASMIEEQVMKKYGDILYQEHPVSANHLSTTVLHSFRRLPH